MLKDYKASRGKNSKVRELEYLFGKLMAISKSLNDRQSAYCMYDPTNSNEK